MQFETFSRAFRAMPLAAFAAAAMLSASPAVAQQPQQPPRPPAATPGAPRPAGPAQAVPPGMRDQQFQDWRVRCGRTQPNQPEVCAAFVEVLLQNTGQRLLNYTVVVVPGQPVPIATLTLPLGLFLPAGAQIAVDGQNPLAAPLQTCVPEGCQVTMNLDQAILPRLQNGKQMNVTFVDNTDERKGISVSVSLAGFAQALAALRR
jgi:invasion protein IalB